MRCRIFGTVELVDDDGRSRPIGSRNQRLVLASLLAQRGRVVSTEALVDTLWPDDPPASAVATLRTYVSRLRQHLGAALLSRPTGYSLVLADDQVDSGRCEALLAAADRAVDPARAADLVRRALAEGGGPAFGAEASAELVRGEAARLDEVYMSARIRLARLDLQAGDIDRAVAQIESLVTDAPHLEPAWAVLVRALTAAGRTADALRAFQRAADQLAELGLEPGPDLRAAEQAALSPETSDGVQAIVPAVRRAHPPHPSTAIVGRQRDLDALTALMQRSRFVTLVGAGGVGKSRLAIEFAGRADATAVWVDLASVTRDSDVAAAALTALGVAATGRSSIDIAGELVDLNALIVFDNAEHLIDGVAATVSALLAASAAVRVLVTSRERLGIEGEYRWHVGPLRAGDSADESGDAALLFVARAAMSAPSVPLRADDSRVHAVVRRLDGVPLAIEMAAAQLATMTIDELDDELSRGLSSLALPRRAAARQRDLGSLIEWSERSLDADELDVLEGFTIFAGSVRSDDATGVLERGDAPTLLRRIAERSLLEAEPSSDGATAFRMLTIVRDHVTQRLQPLQRWGAMQQRHAEWFTAKAEDADAAFRGGDHDHARRRIEALGAELRTAHRFGRSSDSSLAARLSTALHTQARYTTFDEPFAWAEELVHDHDSDAGPGAWASAAARSVARGDLAQAAERSRRALAAAVDARQRILGLDVAADAALFDGRLDEAIAFFDELHDLATVEGDWLFRATGGSGRAMALTYGGDVTGALTVLDQLAATTTDPGPVATGWIEYAYGEALSTTDSSRALSHFDRAIELANGARCRYLEGVSRVSAGSLRARVGDVDVALRSFESLVKRWLDLGERTHQRTTLRNLVVLLHRAGRPRDAAILLGSVDRGAVPTYDDEGRRLDDTRQWALSRLGTDEFDARHYAEGCERDIPAAATWALWMLRSDGQ